MDVVDWQVFNWLVDILNLFCEACHGILGIKYFILCLLVASLDASGSIVASRCAVDVSAL